MEKTWLFLIASATAVQLVFWLGIFARVAFFQPKKVDFPNKTTESSPLNTTVSVVVCARNEAENLQKNLPFLLDQHFDDLEIIVVNDASTDATEAVLSHFLASEKGSRLRVVRLFEKKSPGKKAALAAGIAAARGDILLLTDADCRPASRFWAEKMTAPFFENPKTEIVLGYAPLLDEAEKGNFSSHFLNRFQRFETAWTALQMFGFALAGEPYMGVGRNLAYRKSLFLKVGGFSKHADWPSGDDDLFVNEAARKGSVAVVLEGESFCFSEAKKSWPELVRQKKRHFSVGHRYRMFHQVMLGAQVLSAGLQYLLALVGLCAGFSMVVVSMCIVLRIMALWLVWAFSNRRFREKGLTWLAPLFDAFLILQYVWFSRSIFFRNNKPVSWT